MHEEKPGQTEQKSDEHQDEQTGRIHEDLNEEISEVNDGKEQQSKPRNNSSKEHQWPKPKRRLRLGLA